MLKPRQRKALEILVTSGEVGQAAAAANVSRQTIAKWLKDDAFKQALKDADGLALEALARSLLGMAELATKTLREAMSDKAAPAATRVRAAEITLDRLENMRQLAEFDRRLQAVEENARNGRK